MHFEAREVTTAAEPVTAKDLVVGAVYFSVQFVDPEMFIPVVEPLVYIGKDLVLNDRGVLYFQNAESYRAGIRFESAEADEAAIYAQPESQINHIFDYERALDRLLVCSLRRKKRLD